jgi:P27 family predicted phage terminase small subunit
VSKLKIIKSSKGSMEPPRSLGKHGSNLWARITTEYDVSDSGGKELLTVACQALDRAEALREQIDRDGEIITDARGAMKDHPALRHEISNRSFLTKTLIRLGLAVEAGVRPVGRPPSGGLGITHLDLERNNDA